MSGTDYEKKKKSTWVPTDTVTSTSPEASVAGLVVVRQDIGHAINRK